MSVNAMQVTDFALQSIDNGIRTLFATTHMGLFTGNPGLSVNSVLADLAALEPTYTGYARAALTLGAQRRNANNDYIDGFAPGLFQPTGPANLPQTVNGYFVVVTIAANDFLWGAEYFTTPYTFLSQFSGLAVTFDGYVKNLTTWGGLCATC